MKIPKVTETCGNCRFHELSSCRRYPPIRVGDNFGFPTTLGYEWCGEWVEEEVRLIKKTSSVGMSEYPKPPENETFENTEIFKKGSWLGKIFGNIYIG